MLARTHIAAFLLALFVSAVLTPIVRRLAHKYTLYDMPGSRKIHLRPIPRLGGIAIAFAFFAPVAALLLYLNKPGRLLLVHQQQFIWALFGGGGVILALGVYDDIQGANHRLKFSVQFLVATLVFLVGLRIEHLGIPGAGRVVLGPLAFPITVLWIVGVINAVNLIDGLDGLASGVSFFAVVTLFISGLLDGPNGALVCLITACMAGAIVGFLFYNFNPATIFMGDSGSMFVGFVLATMSIAAASKGTTLVALAVPLLALGLPLFDTLFAVARRFRTGRPVFSADQGHVHHRLMDLGLSQRQTVLVLYSICMLLTVTALVLRATRDFLAGGALFLAGTLVFVMVHLLRFRDVVALRMSERIGELERRVFDEGLDRLRQQGRAIRGADSWDGAWKGLKECAKCLGVTRMDLKLHVRPNKEENLEHELRYVSAKTDIETRCGKLVVPLMDDRFIYGELRFVFPTVPSVDDQRRAFMYLMGEYVVEFFETSYSGRAEQLFVVQRHPTSAHAGADQGPLDS
ncbi:MAG: undecaprenyl-phosphate alpha-N-acetylglucosaminyl 1-phosphate transferase [Myxococcales bacterium]|nr:undecaprenyl-phosphate alpha-N-acetylglucosaminyl 1-phosphate transferase [Myxococcales bacterium]